MIRVFGVAIFLSAALLFLIQPMAAKLVLPILGGSPSVWNTTMMFFQTMLIGGYLYSHLLTKKLTLKLQFVVHGAVLGCVVLALPIGLPEKLFSNLTPTNWLLATLSIIAGLPYFAASTTGPLLQYWFGRTTDPRAKDPYFLYAASNAGSFFGLLCFPFVIEPNFALDGQAEVWTVGYCVLAALVLIAGLLTLRFRREDEAPVAPQGGRVAAAPTWRSRLLWIALAAAPSSLSLGATAAITTDVAAVPLLWIGPLAIYLLTYTLAFSGRFPIGSKAAGRAAIILAAVVSGLLVSGAKSPLLAIVAAHLGALGVSAYACHRRLYELRPDTSRLTEFYLLASIGGALGGVFNAIVAPMVFRSFLEYPIAMAACLLLLTPTDKSLRIAWWKHAAMCAVTVGAACAIIWTVARSFPGREALPVQGWCALGLGLLVAALPAGGQYRVATVILSCVVFSAWLKGTVFKARSFFGVYEIYASPDVLRLGHGTTLHGEQFRDPVRARIPISYYHRLGPLGDIFSALRSEPGPRTIAAVGLGAGSIAAYGEPGDHIIFFEIDPLVRAIAEDGRLFTYIKDARARGVTVEIRIGDGRIGVASASETFDLIILDAFSSDSVPIHLLTLEAIEQYKAKLAPEGMIAAHTSNRYFDIAYMLAHVANRADLKCGMRDDRMAQPDAAAERKDSTWIVLSNSVKQLTALAQFPEWFGVKLDPKQRIWTDSYSSLFDVPWR
ncbi:MAG: hypothetical protein JSS51_03715 [Planctomycetes bacterium]|nr:hypothetical protein [Planctomycetota bacterium]